MSDSEVPSSLEKSAPTSSQDGHSFLFVRLIDKLSVATVTLSLLALLAMTAIIVFEVVSRYVFNSPTYWVTEIST